MSVDVSKGQENITKKFTESKASFPIKAGVEENFRTEYISWNVFEKANKNESLI